MSWLDYHIVFRNEQTGLWHCAPEGDISTSWSIGYMSRAAAEERAGMAETGQRPLTSLTGPSANKEQKDGND